MINYPNSKAEIMGRFFTTTTKLYLSVKISCQINIYDLAHGYVHRKRSSYDDQMLPLTELIKAFMVAQICTWRLICNQTFDTCTPKLHATITSHINHFTRQHRCRKSLYGTQFLPKFLISAVITPLSILCLTEAI